MISFLYEIIYVKLLLVRVDTKCVRIVVNNVRENISIGNSSSINTMYQNLRMREKVNMERGSYEV